MSDEFDRTAREAAKRLVDQEAEATRRALEQRNKPVVPQEPRESNLRRFARAAGFLPERSWDEIVEDVGRQQENLERQAAEDLRRDVERDVGKAHQSRESASLHPPEHEHHPTTKTLDYIGLGIILAPAPEVVAMYLRHEDIDWLRVAVAFGVSTLLGAVVLWFAHGWRRTAGAVGIFKAAFNRADDYFFVRVAVIASFMVIPVLMAPLISGPPASPLHSGQNSPSVFTQEQVDKKIGDATRPLETEIAALNDKLQQAAKQIVAAATNSPENPEAQAGAITWENYLGFSQTGDSDGPIFLAIILNGKNTGGSPVALKDAYIISELTGAKKTLLINVGINNPVSISEVNQIPPDAAIQLWAPFERGGLRAGNFLAQWGAFRFHAEYGDTKYDHVFTDDFVRRRLAQFPATGIGPHVTKKSSEP